MKRRRFTEEQIIQVLTLQAAGAKAADLCRQHGISEPTLYNCQAKYGGMTVSEARRLKTLEQENRRLKKLLEGCRTASAYSAGSGRSASGEPPKRSRHHGDHGGRDFIEPVLR